MCMSIDELVKAVQTKLNVGVDGKPGFETWSAIYSKIIGNPIKNNQSPIVGKIADPRSESNINTLLPEVQGIARFLIEQAANAGISIKILSGLRTYAEQDALYKQGGVTKARGGYSNHNFGIAFDIGVFEGTKYIPESSKYKAVGSLGVQLGLDWGGNWKSFKDEPHFQLRPNWATNMTESAMLAELRARKESGKAVFIQS
jgi:peptidoglycan L-alanyl-D-glutamate endopeptidase CwlK